MEIKSTAINWTFKCWKCNLLPWKCFESLKRWFFMQIW